MSIPGRYGIVVRPTEVRILAQDRNGNRIDIEDAGLAARGFCHEIDHLEGHLYTELCDHLLTDEEVQQYMDEHPDEFED